MTTTATAETGTAAGNSDENSSALASAMASQPAGIFVWGMDQHHGLDDTGEARRYSEIAGDA